MASTAAVTSPRRRADQRGQRGEDARDLLALLADELAQAVVLLDERERLDEQGLSRAGRVVHDARHRAAGVRAHGQHRPAAALGEELLLQVRAQARGELAQPLAGTLARDRLLAAQRAQPRGRAVAHALGVDRLLDRERELVERRRDRVGPRRQQRQLLALRDQRTASLERGAQRQRDREQHLGVERDRACGARGVLADVRGRDELGRRRGRRAATPRW